MTGEVQGRVGVEGDTIKQTEPWSWGGTSRFHFSLTSKTHTHWLSDVPWASDGDESSKSWSQLVMVLRIPRDNAKTKRRACLGSGNQNLEPQAADTMSCFVHCTQESLFLPSLYLISRVLNSTCPLWWTWRIRLNCFSWLFIPWLTQGPPKQELREWQGISTMDVLDTASYTATQRENYFICEST